MICFLRLSRQGRPPASYPRIFSFSRFQSVTFARKFLSRAYLGRGYIIRSLHCIIVTETVSVGA